LCRLEEILADFLFDFSPLYVAGLKSLFEMQRIVFLRHRVIPENQNPRAKQPPLWNLDS
jgi:hypothetical protein